MLYASESSGFRAETCPGWPVCWEGMAASSLPGAGFHMDAPLIPYGTALSRNYWLLYLFGPLERVSLGHSLKGIAPGAVALGNRFFGIKFLLGNSSTVSPRRKSYANAAFS